MSSPLVFVLLASTASAADWCPGGKITQADREALLNGHNSLRSRIALGTMTANGLPVPQAANMEKMVWDCELESLAQKWSESTNCKTEHAEKISEGENLYSFGKTGMAWATSNRLGCGIEVNCEMDAQGFYYTLVVCRYIQSCNIYERDTGKGEVYSIGKACSLCPEGTECENETGLCIDKGTAPPSATTTTAQPETTTTTALVTTTTVQPETTTTIVSAETTTTEPSDPPNQIESIIIHLRCYAFVSVLHSLLSPPSRVVAIKFKMYQTMRSPEWRGTFEVSIDDPIPFLLNSDGPIKARVGNTSGAPVIVRIHLPEDKSLTLMDASSYKLIGANADAFFSLAVNDKMTFVHGESLHVRFDFCKYECQETMRHIKCFRTSVLLVDEGTSQEELKELDENPLRIADAVEAFEKAALSV